MLTFERKERKTRRGRVGGLNLQALPLYGQNQSCVKKEDPTLAERSDTDSVMEIYEPFSADGFVSLNTAYAQSFPIKLLRDTGASQLFSQILCLFLRRLLLTEQVSLFRV